MIKTTLLTRGISIPNVMKDMDKIKKPLKSAGQKADETLSEAELLYHTLFNQSPDGILLIDLSGHIIEFNEATHRQLGYSREEFKGLHLSDIDPFQSIEEIQASIKKVIQTGSDEFEVKHRTKAGDIRDVHVITRLMPLAGRTVFHTIWRDITEHKRADRALLELNANLQALINAMPDLIVFKDVQGRHLVVNKAVEEYTGLKREALVGKTNEEVLPPDLAAFCRTSDEAALGSPRPTQTEEQATGSDGEKKFLDTIKAPIHDAQGKLVGLVSVSRDITGRKRMEEKLKESEQQYRALFEGSPDAIFIADPETGVIIDANPAAGRLLGRRQEEIIGLHQTRLHPPWKDQLSREVFQQHIRETNQRGVTHLLESSVMRSDGTEVPVEILAQSVVIKGKQVLLGVFRDVTERRKMEEALRKSEKFVRDILETVDEGFVVIGRDYRIVSANKAYLDQVKMPLEEVIGMHCYEISHRIDKPCHESGEECSVKHTFDTGEPHRALHIHQDREKNPIYVETKSYPLKDAWGNTASAIEIINNTTEKKRLEEQLRHAQKMEAVGQLAGGIAHDFNNILTAITGYGSLMLRKMAGDDPSKNYLQQILDSAQRAASLTQGLLAFSRKQVISPKPAQVNKIIENVEKLLRRLIGEDVELEVALAAEDLTVMADSGQIEQVLVNLATNARDAMSDGGRLTIRTESAVLDGEFVKMHGYGNPGRYACVSVTDTGTGMDKQTRERIFEPFYTTKEVGKGTGLGLSIAYGIVKQHNGHITCYSEPGNGATFKIYLPLIKREAPRMETEVLHPVAGGTETVLIAEDDATVRALVKEVLLQSGYNVIEAADGEDAIGRFAGHRDSIRLLILDVIMPKKNGREVYEEIRKDRPDIKVIFTSGYTADIINKKGVPEENLNFISKPVSPAELLRKVREAIDEGMKR
jgi:PAS domain S-box-containing protein